MPTIDLAQWRRVFLSGSDAAEWLNDLVSAGIDGESRRSLLLTPTGRIRADFHVLPQAEGFLLIQDPVQPKPIEQLLAPYILSSDATVQAPTDRGPQVATWWGDTLKEVKTGFPPPMSLENFDVWRILQGIPRFGMDLDEDSLPQEAGWERFIDFTKGCFMGQEAMAKIRNMGGHPTRVVRALISDREIAVGEPIVADGVRAGAVTSAEGMYIIGRVRWDARDETLRTEGGAALRVR